MAPCVGVEANSGAPGCSVCYVVGARGVIVVVFGTYFGGCLLWEET